MNPAVSPEVFDVVRARKETPGCAHVLHFNNAGASLMPRCVLDSVVGHLQLEASIGGYEAAYREREKIEAVYDRAAALLHCSRDEIAVVENATRAWDMAFYSIPFSDGDRILTAMSEYASNYIPFLQMARKKKLQIQPIPNDEHGQVSLEALEEMMDERVRLIAVTHVPTNGGLVNPAAGIGKIAQKYNTLYLLDACQSVGQIPVDVREIGCDMLSTTGRKYLRGPRGTGLLFVKAPLIERLEPPFLDLHAARWTKPDDYTILPNARRFENWETNMPGKIGLGAALQYASDWGIESIWNRVSFVAGALREGLSHVPGVCLHDLGRVKCGIVSFRLQGKSPGEIFRYLSGKKINVSVALKEHTLLDMDSRGLDRLVRASVHYYNSLEEIERFCAALESLR